MIRVVLDTNIIVSAMLQPLGPPAEILMMALSGLLQLCISGSVYAEYEEILSRPRFKLSPEIIAGALYAIREQGLWVRPMEKLRVCLDPDDDLFLDCARAAHADYLVTGNVKHFPAAWEGTRVVTPRWFLDNVQIKRTT